eukprot:scaffold71932_cov43-Prasinocladus_malaysianus.AAC.1
MVVVAKEGLLALVCLCGQPGNLVGSCPSTSGDTILNNLALNCLLVCRAGAALDSPSDIWSDGLFEV